MFCIPVPKSYLMFCIPVPKTYTWCSVSLFPTPTWCSLFLFVTPLPDVLYSCSQFLPHVQYSCSQHLPDVLYSCSQALPDVCIPVPTWPVPNSYLMFCIPVPSGGIPHRSIILSARTFPAGGGNPGELFWQNLNAERWAPHNNYLGFDWFYKKCCGNDSNEGWKCAECPPYCSWNVTNRWVIEK